MPEIVTLEDIVNGTSLNTENDTAKSDGDIPTPSVPSDNQTEKSDGDIPTPSVELDNDPVKSDGDIATPSVESDNDPAKSGGDISTPSDPSDIIDSSKSDGVIPTPPVPDKIQNKKAKKAKPPTKPENLIPRGQPKSGRFWKTPKTKASTLIHTRGLRIASTFEKKEKLRADLKHIKEVSRARVAERNRIKEEHKERRRQNLKKQEENKKKSEIVQVIRNPAKIKRMRKKHLRNIEKRDTTNM